MKKIISLILTLSMIVSMFTTFSAVAEEITFDFENGKVVNFPLSEAVGANSKYFLNKEDGTAATTFPTDAYKGLDYGGRALKEGLALNQTAAKTIQAPTGTSTDAALDGDTFSWMLFDISTEIDAPVSKLGVMLYDDGSGTYWWKIKEGAYEVVSETVEDTTTYSLKWNDTTEKIWAINPYEKVVKIVPTDTQYIEDANLKAKYESLNESVIDIPDGNYEDISILIASEGYERSMYITPIYLDGAGEKINVSTKHHNICKVNAQTGATSGNLTDPAFDWSNGLNYLYGMAYGKYFDGKLGNNLATRFRGTTITTNPERVLDKVKFTAKGQYDNPLTVVSMQGTTVSVASLISKLSDEITSENYNNQIEALAKVDAALSEIGATKDDLAGDLAEKYNTTVNAIKEYDRTSIIYKDKTTNFPISEETGANAKYFMLYEGAEYNLAENYTDYVPGLDYDSSINYDTTNEGNFPTGDFDTDISNLFEPSRALVYRIDSPANNNNILNLKTINSKLYWPINGVNYEIDPAEKVIKLYTKIKTTNISDSNLASRFASLNRLTFDVTDGYYDSIGFLATASYNRTLNVTLNYKDGSKTTLTKNISTAPYSSQNEGTIYTQIIGTNAITSGGRYFQPAIFDTDKNKELDSVTMTSSYRANPIIIISAWGTNNSLAKIIDSLSSASDENYDADSEIKKLEEIETALSENNLSIEDLDDNFTEKITVAKADNVNYISKSLPESVTVDTVIDAENSIKIIEKAAADYGIAIPTEAQARIKKLKEEISKIYVIYSPSVDIPLGDGANSSVFWENGVELPGTLNDPNDNIYTSKKYDYMLDWKQSLWWDSTIEKGINDSWTHSPVYYKTSDSTAKTYIPLDKDGNWTLPYIATDTNGNNYTETLKYHIDINSKIIQLKAFSSNAQKFDAEASELYSDRIKSMKSTTVNVVKNHYDTIYVLASSVNGQAIGSNFKAQVYYEGEEIPTDAPVTLGILTDAALATKYQEITNDTTKTKVSEFDSSVGYASNIAWYSYPIKCDPLKKVEKITFTMTEGNRVLLIASMAGKLASPEDILNAVPETITVDNYADTLAAKEYLDQYVEYNNIDMTSVSTKYEVLNKKLEKAKSKALFGNIEYVDGKITIVTSNYTGQDFNFNILVMVTDEKKNVIKFEKLDAKSVKDSVKKTIEIEYTVPDTEGSEIKIFTVNSLADIQPLAHLYQTSAIK